MLNSTLSSASRFGHVLLMIGVFLLALVVGLAYPDQLNSYNTVTKLNLSANCASVYVDECIYRQLVYRAALTLVIVFTILALASYYSEYANRALWPVKFVAAFGTFVGLLWADNAAISGFAEVARVVSFFWLLVQGLLYLDVAHDAHDVWMAAADEAERETGDARSYYAGYVLAAFAVVGLTLVGTTLLFVHFGCATGQAFASVTLVTGVLLTVVSLLNTVNKGLLTPCLMWAYSTFLCWYALLSSPDAACNADATGNWGPAKITAVVAVSNVSVLVLVYCVVYGTAILNIFNPHGEAQSLPSPSHQQQQRANYAATRELKSVFAGEDKVSAALRDGHPSLSQPLSPTADVGSSSVNIPVASSGTTAERVYFHLLLAMFSCYAAMVLTSWGNADGSPDTAPAATGSSSISGSSGSGSSSSGSTGMTRAEESMWVKAAAQWVFVLLYAKVLHAAYLDNL